MSIERKRYPCEVGEEERSPVAPWRLLRREDAGRREDDLRAVFNGLRCIVKEGAPWRRRPGALPPRAAVCRQAQRRLAAGCFEALVDDPRAVLRPAAGRKAGPAAAIIAGRTLRSAPESGERAGYDGARARLSLPKGARRARRSARSPTPPAHWPGPIGAMPASGPPMPQPDRASLSDPASGRKPNAASPSCRDALLPQRRVVERPFAWATRLGRLVEDHQRHAETLAGLHIVAFARFMTRQASARTPAS